MSSPKPPAIPPDRPVVRPRIMMPDDLRELLDQPDSLVEAPLAVPPPAAAPPTVAPPSIGLPHRPAAAKRPEPAKNGEPAKNAEAPASEPSRTRVDPVAGTRGLRGVGGSDSGWRSGIAAGATSLIIGFALVVVPAIAAFVATAGDTVNLRSSWVDAFRVGVVVWLQSLGGSAPIEGGTVSVIPLGLSLVLLWIVRAASLRALAPTLTALTTAAGVYVGGVGLAALAVGELSIRVVLGAVLVVACGSASAIARTRRRSDPQSLPEFTSGRVSGYVDQIRAIHPAVKIGVRGGVVAALGLVVAAGLVAAAWLLAGRASIAAVAGALGDDPLSALFVLLSQLALVPLLLAWAVPWLLGPGFVVGEGTLWSATDVITAPLPSFPFLGALPVTAPAVGGALTWLVPVACGVLGGWFIARRTDGVGGVIAVGVAAATTALLAAGIAVVGDGSAGPGRMAIVGSDPVAVAVWAAIKIGLGGACAVGGRWAWLAFVRRDT